MTRSQSVITAVVIFSARGALGCESRGEESPRNRPDVPRVSRIDVNTIDGAEIRGGPSGQSITGPTPAISRYDWSPSAAKPPLKAPVSFPTEQARLLASAASVPAGTRIPVTVVVKETSPTDWAAFSRLKGAQRDSFLAARKTTVASDQASVTAWLKSIGAMNVQSLWLVDGVYAEVPAQHVATLATRADVDHLSGHGPDKPGMAWTGAESKTGLRVDQLYVNGIDGHHGGRWGGSSWSGRIRIAVIEAGTTTNVPIRDHVGWVRSDGPNAIKFVKDCGTAGCPTTSATATSYTHGNLVAWVAGGSIEGGQDPGITSFYERAARSGNLNGSYIQYYVSGGSTQGQYLAIQQAVLDGADIINMSSALGTGTTCNPTANPASVNEALQFAVNAGVVPVACGGNDGHTDGCTVWYPALRTETLAINGLASNDRLVDYSDLTLLNGADGSSKGGLPITLRGGGVSTLSSIDLVAPGRFTEFFDVAPDGYFSPIGSEAGCSFATPAAAAAIGGLKHAMETVGSPIINARALMTNALLLGDGWDGGQTFPIEGDPVALPTRLTVGMSNLSGGGRLAIHWPFNFDLTPYWGWGWRSVIIHQGETVEWPVGTACPAQSSISQWKWAILWTEPDLTNVSGVDFYVVDKSTGYDVFLYADTGYDVRSKFRLLQGDISGRCLWMRAHGYNVPPSGTTFYSADYFHSNAQVH